MSKLTQIALNGTELPYISGDRYRCYEEELSRTKVMAAGNLTKEVLDPGLVWRADYSCDDMDETTFRTVRAILHSGTTFTAAVLPENGDEMITITALMTAYTPPTFAFAENGKPVWRGMAFSIREVAPHA